MLSPQVRMEILLKLLAGFGDQVIYSEQRHLSLCSSKATALGFEFDVCATLSAAWGTAQPFLTIPRMSFRYLFWPFCQANSLSDPLISLLCLLLTFSSFHSAIELWSAYHFNPYLPHRSWDWILVEILYSHLLYVWEPLFRVLLMMTAFPVWSALWSVPTYLV